MAFLHVIRADEAVLEVLRDRSLLSVPEIEDLVEERSGGKISFVNSQYHISLKHMLERGWVHVVKRVAPMGGGPARPYYALTGLGVKKALSTRATLAYFYGFREPRSTTEPKKVHEASARKEPLVHRGEKPNHTIHESLCSTDEAWGKITEDLAVSPLDVSLFGLPVENGNKKRYVGFRHILRNCEIYLDHDKRLVRVKCGTHDHVRALSEIGRLTVFHSQTETLISWQRTKEGFLRREIKGS